MAEHLAKQANQFGLDAQVQELGATGGARNEPSERQGVA